MEFQEKQTFTNLLGYVWNAMILMAWVMILNSVYLVRHHVLANFVIWLDLTLVLIHLLLQSIKLVHLVNLLIQEQEIVF